MEIESGNNPFLPDSDECAADIIPPWFLGEWSEPPTESPTSSPTPKPTPHPTPQPCRGRKKGEICGYWHLLKSDTGCYRYRTGEWTTPKDQCCSGRFYMEINGWTYNQYRCA